MLVQGFEGYAIHASAKKCRTKRRELNDDGGFFLRNNLSPSVLTDAYAYDSHGES